jgi:hypothetical protein
MDNQAFTHILQKKGVLKSFSVAKIVKHSDIKELEALIKTVASDEAEYKKMLDEELAKLGNMHDKQNPIPGLIYTEDVLTKRRLLFAIAQKFCDTMKKQKFTKKELVFLISAMVSKFGLCQDDFLKLNDELEEEENED